MFFKPSFSNAQDMTFVFPSINGTVKPRERSGHIAVHFDGYVVIWGGYYNVSLETLRYK